MVYRNAGERLVCEVMSSHPDPHVPTEAHCLPGSNDRCLQWFVKKAAVEVCGKVHDVQKQLTNKDSMPPKCRLVCKHVTQQNFANHQI